MIRFQSPSGWAIKQCTKCDNVAANTATAPLCVDIYQLCYCMQVLAVGFLATLEVYLLPDANT